MSETTIERCSLCILPKSPGYIEFNSDGVCNICSINKSSSTGDEYTQKRKNELSECITKVKMLGKGRQYDCVIGISGGRDSSYLLYLLVKKYKMRCLAAYYRTPFTPDVIDSNVKRMVDKLNTPIVYIPVSKEFHQKRARELMMLWKDNPLPLIVNLACSPCKFLNGEIFKIAHKNNVKTIIYGGNRYENFQLVSANINVDPKKRHSFWFMFAENLLNAKRGAILLFKCKELFKYLPIAFKASIMYRNPHTCYLRLRHPGIQCINYFDYGEWNESELENVLLELGWKLPPNCNSKWRADCSFNELKNCIFSKTVGITYMDALLSNMVRVGLLSRDEALRRIGVEGKISPMRVAEACDILNLPNDWFS